jgi:hypothetical protein
MLRGTKRLLCLTDPRSSFGDNVVLAEERKTESEARQGSRACPVLQTSE